MYSLEPPFYRGLNKACREKDDTKIDHLGPFATALGEIIRFQERNRTNCQTDNFKLYRGLSLSPEEISGYTFIKNSMDSKKKGDEIDWTFHLEGFTSTSFKREIAEEFAEKSVWGERKAVVFEYDV